MTRHPLQTALFRAALVGVAAALVGCLGIHTRRPYDPSQARSDADVDRTKPTLPEQQIDEFGFAVYWDSFIRDEVITGVWVEGTGRDPLRTDRALRRGSKPQLYAFTAAHRLYQIDMHSGMVNWVYDVGKPLSFMDGRPIAEWSYTERDQETGLQFYDEIFFVANDWLYALDKDNGSLLWRLELPFGASSPPAASRTHVFVGAWNDRIYAIQKDRPSVIDWNWRTDGDLVARPAVDSDSSQVFVASSDGNLYTFDAAKGDPKEPFPTGGRLRIDPIAYRNLLYLGSEDFNLYVLNTDEGTVVHRFGAGAPITSVPVACMNPLNPDGSVSVSVYFAAMGEGMFALERQARTSGSRRIPHPEQWNRPDAFQFICRGMDDVYLREPGGDANQPRKFRISRLDAADGHFRDAIELANVDYYVSNYNSPHAPDRNENLVGGMIVLGFRNGWIIALKEKTTMPGGTLPTQGGGPG